MRKFDIDMDFHKDFKKRFEFGFKLNWKVSLEETHEYKDCWQKNTTIFF